MVLIIPPLDRMRQERVAEVAFSVDIVVVPNEAMTVSGIPMFLGFPALHVLKEV